jgi:hypothetical protein
VALYQNILPLYRDKMALYFRIINQRVTKAKNGYLKEASYENDATQYYGNILKIVLTS